jgi:hypothetical protein
MKVQVTVTLLAIHSKRFSNPGGRIEVLAHKWSRYKNAVASASIGFHGIHVFVMVRVMSMLYSNKLLTLEGLLHTMEYEAELSYPIR